MTSQKLIAASPFYVVFVHFAFVQRLVNCVSYLEFPVTFKLRNLNEITLAYSWFIMNFVQYSLKSLGNKCIPSSISSNHNTFQSLQSQYASTLPSDSFHQKWNNLKAREKEPNEWMQNIAHSEHYRTKNMILQRTFIHKPIKPRLRHTKKHKHNTFIILGFQIERLLVTYNQNGSTDSGDSNIGGGLQ